jgi:hypothetical protein
LKKYLWDEGRSSTEAAVIILPNGKSIHEVYQWRVDFVDELVVPPTNMPPNKYLWH